MDLLSWMFLHRRQLVPERAFDLSSHLYLIDLYNQIAREVVVQKAAQVGVSEYAISHALWSADQRAATVLYTFPTDRHVSDFSSARIGPAIEASDYLSHIIVDAGGEEHKRGADRVTLKRVRDRFVYLRGAQVTREGMAPQLKSIDADVLEVDELDEMDPRALVIARKRLGHSALKEVRIFSTPSYPGTGIHAEYLASDQRRWFIRCPHCGERQPLTLGQVVIESDALGRPVHWHGQEEGRAYAACQHCGGELDRLAPGEWVAAEPGREVVGYHISKLMSPFTSVLAIVTALQTADETARREAYNQDLGEPYTPRGGRLDQGTLNLCRRPYAHGPVVLSGEQGPQAEKTVMGVDVGGVLHCVIRGARDPQSGERPQRFAGTVDSFEQVETLIHQYSVKACVIDALPETRKARELQEKFTAGTVWLAYYSVQKQGSKDVSPIQWDEERGIVNLDRTRTLDDTMGRFAAHSHTLPDDIRSVPDYCAHLTNVTRVLEKGPGGETVARYVETGPDHYVHGENYCTVAEGAPLVPEIGLSWL